MLSKNTPGQWFTCEQCGKPAYKLPCRIRQATARYGGARFFCSRSCYFANKRDGARQGPRIRPKEAWKHAGIAPEDARPCAAPGCTNPILTRDKRTLFCSRACYDTSGRQKKRNHHTGKMFSCEACGESFYRYPADIRKAQKNGSRIRFCSKACTDGLKASTNITLTCPECDRSFVVWASRVVHSAKNTYGIYCSERCRDTANGQRHMPPGGRGKWGRREDLGHFVRSTWEANVCRVLLALGLTYAYEPQSFRLPNGTFYRPDLLVESCLWIEVKGWMNSASAAKIAAFRNGYPQYTLIVIGKDEYLALERAFAAMVPNWE